MTVRWNPTAEDLEGEWDTIMSRDGAMDSKITMSRRSDGKFLVEAVFESVISYRALLDDPSELQDVMAQHGG